MARGRFISKRIAHSAQLAEVSLLADYLFTRCIPHLDVEGRMIGHPTVVKAVVVPLRPEISADRIPALLSELDEAGLVVWYEVGGKQVLEFPGFPEHNKVNRKKEAPSHLPMRTEDARLLRLDHGHQLDLLRRPPELVRRTPDLPVHFRDEGEVEGEGEVKPSSSAREAFAGRLDDETLEVVADFLMRVPTASRSRWVALIGGWLDGLDIRPPTPTQAALRIGLSDYLTREPDPDFAPIHVRRFVERAARESARQTGPPAKRNGTDTPPDPLKQQYGELLGGKQHAT